MSDKAFMRRWNRAASGPRMPWPAKLFLIFHAVLWSVVAVLLIYGAIK